MEEQEKNTTEAGKKGLLNNWIVRNLLGAVLLLLLLVWGAKILLNVVTDHGKTIAVPDLTGMSVTEATRTARGEGLRVEVIDSIYVRRMEKGAVYAQNPKAGSQVKKGRRILLTTNAIAAKKVGMPNLVGYSMRQAKAEISSRGLTLGKLIYVEDMATNNVLRQLYRNRQIAAGKLIDSGSPIDLVVGLNPTDNRTYVPDVKDMKYLRALDVIHDNSLNIGKLVFDSSVKDYGDTLSAVVYKQVPAASGAPVLIGSEVTLHLSIDPNKVLITNK